MEYSTLFDSSFEELQKGFCEREGRFCCVWCRAQFADNGSVSQHIKENHSVEDQFFFLLGADSILKLTAEEKQLYMAMFSNSQQKHVAEIRGINQSLLRAKRSRLFYGEYQRAKLALLLYSLIFEKQPKRKYIKTPQVHQHVSNALKIPFFTKDDRRIVSYADKDDLHGNSKYKNYYHATTIILPTRLSSAGKCTFLCGNRYESFVDSYTQKRRNWVSTSKNMWDCLGGHVEGQDLSTNNIVDDATFLKCALRELSEELHLRNGKIENDSLEYLFDVITPKHAYSEGQRFNNEISKVYRYLLPGEVVDTRVREKTIDTLGRVVTSEFPVKYFSLDELIDIFTNNPHELCDGLGRVIADIMENPENNYKLRWSCQIKP